METFPELLRDLKHGGIKLIEQNLKLRSYYNRYKKPIGAGLIDWSQSAEAIYRIYRALNFGKQENSFASNKIIVADKLFIPLDMEISSEQSEDSPGRIIKIKNESIEISTKTKRIALGKLCDLDGNIYTPIAFCKEFGLKEKKYLSNVTSEYLHNVEKLMTQYAQTEPFIVMQYQQYTHLSYPFLSLGIAPVKEIIFDNTYSCREMIRQIKKIENENCFDAKKTLTTLIVAYLYKVSGQTGFSINAMGKEACLFFLPSLPLTFYFEEKNSYFDLLKVVSSEMDKYKEQQCQSDIFLRYPQLNGCNLYNLFAFIFVDNDSELQNFQNFNNAINIIINIRDMSYRIVALNSKLGFDERLLFMLKKVHSHINELAMSIIKYPQNSLYLHSLLSIDEQTRLLTEETNNINDDFFSEGSLITYLNKSFDLHNNHLAVITQETQITYKQLNQSANRLAHYLLEHGIKKNNHVAVCLPRTPSLIVSLLAILKIGAAYVPVEPTHPHERKLYIVNDAKATAVISNTDLKKQFNNILGKIICINEIEENFTQHSEQDPKVSIRDSDPAYLIYTSGSTGMPKGVLIQHGSLLNYLLWCCTYYPRGGKGTLLHSSIAFDMSVTSIFLPLLVGDALHLVVDVHVDGFIEEMKKPGCFSFIKLTPTHLRILNSQLTPDQIRNKAKALIVGGEKLLPSDIKYWQEHDLKTSIINEYGPTEATVACSAYRIKDNLSFTESIPIGKRIANTELYILDKHLQLVPVGVVGELHIGGKCLAQGYWGREDLTQERFIKNPFYPMFSKSTRIYKTGDWVRMGAEGELEYLGRIDSQIKWRGYRIEVGEIEACLIKHGDVDQAVVELTSDQFGELQLVSYVVEGEFKPTSAELRSYLSQILPEYMVPTVFIFLKEMPLMGNGKVDRKALANLFLAQRSNEVKYFAPQTEHEKVIATIWQEVLNIDHISVEENFFDLGGHSLLAIKVVSRLRQKFKWDFSVRLLFESPTIKELAKDIQSTARNEPDVQKINPIKLHSFRKSIPLSFSQKGLWFLQQLEPENCAYNETRALRLQGTFCKKSFNQALHFMVQRHASYRAFFVQNEGVACQEIVSPDAINFDIEEINLIDMEADNKSSIIEQIYYQECIRPFNLEFAPLLRCKLLILANNDYIFLISKHHIIVDDWSFDIFYKELSVAYKSFLNGQQPQLKDLQINYIDYALWQQHWLTTDEAKNQLAYWRAKLENRINLEFPTDYQRPVRQKFKGENLSFHLLEEYVTGLKSLAQKTQATPYVILLSLFDVLLARYTGQEDIIIGTPIANRNNPQTEDVIGCFVNILLIRSNLGGNPTFFEFIIKNKEVIFEAQANQDMPFELLVNELQPVRETNANPLFQILFELENVENHYCFPEIKVTDLNFENKVAKFDLTLTVYLSQTDIKLNFEYNTDLFKRTTIKRFQQHFLILLDAVLHNPQQPIWSLPLLTFMEKQQMLNEWNETSVSFPLDKCAYQLFEDRAKIHPQRSAVRCNQVELSYDTVNKLANKLAHALLEYPIDIDCLVAFYLNRSNEYLVSMLGVWKAGGAFVPLNPQHPNEKNRAILKQMEYKVLLTEKIHYESAKLLVSDRPILVIEDILSDSRLLDCNLTPKLSNQHLAYIIFTSGSTGTPKGAMVEQVGMLNHLCAKVKDLNLTENDNVAQIATQVFDVSIWQYMAVLLTGGQVTVFTEESAWNPLQLLPRMVENKITIFESVPSHMMVILDELEHDPGYYNLSRLKWFIMNGEPLHPDLCKRWFKLFPNIPMINAYGPTECSDDVTHFKIFSNTCLNSMKYVPISGTLPNMQLYVLDTYLNPVPIGVRGELYIAGIGVGRGYLNDPEKTVQSFLNNPFNPGTRLYKTGDLVCYRENGELEFLSRSDNQVKIRGLRIELGEIEVRLSKHPDVADVVVKALDLNNNKQLVAYITSKAEKLTVNSLRQFLLEILPEYMVPSFYVVMDAMPLTASGKIDHNALPMPAIDQTLEQNNYIAPSTEVEKTLTQIWADVLKVNKEFLGVNHNFFELGGDSILSIQIIAKARQFGLQLTPRQIFQYQTIADLARVAQDAKADDVVQADQFTVTGFINLTPIQGRFFSHKTSHLSHYNQSFFFELNEKVLPDLFRLAIEQVIKHHDVLRARYQYDAESRGWLQYNLDDEKVDRHYKMEYFYIKDMSIAESNMFVYDTNLKMQSMLNIENAHNMNIVLYDFGKVQKLFIIVHHLVIDGVSWRIFLEDVETCYRQLKENVNSRLPAKTTSYKQWAELLQIYAQSEKVIEEINYWEKQILKSEQQNDAKNENVYGSAGQLEVILDKEATQALLKKVPEAFNTRINEILLSALLIAYAEWLGENTNEFSLTIDLEGHGREYFVDHVDLSRTIGWFTTIFPVKLFSPSLTDLAILIKSIKEQIRSIPHYGLNYGVLRYLTKNELKNTLINSGSPPILFNYLGQFDANFTDGHLFKLEHQFSGLDISPGFTRSHLIDINSIIINDKLTLYWTFCKKSYQEFDIRRLADTYVTSLKKIINYCCRSNVGEYTPSDFELAKIDPKTLDNLLSSIADQYVE